MQSDSPDHEHDRNHVLGGNLKGLSTQIESLTHLAEEKATHFRDEQARSRFLHGHIYANKERHPAVFIFWADTGTATTCLSLTVRATQALLQHLIART